MSGFLTKALAAVAVLLSAPMGQAQGLSTADQVRPILQMTAANWIAVREWQGQDLLYFTQLLPFRCGLEGIRYAVNDAKEFTLFAAEPCPPDAEGAVFATLEADTYLPYITLPLGSIETVAVSITYDDGGVQTQVYKRADVMTP